MFTIIPHPVGDISYQLHFLQARENPGIVYDQAAVLLLKVIACLLCREPAVLESVYADGKLAHNKWNQTTVLNWYVTCQEWIEARVG